MERIVRLGNARLVCACGNVLNLGPENKYLYECVMAFQTSDRIIIRSSYYKLALAESIIGMLSRFKVRELNRKTIKLEDKEFIDITIAVG